MSEKVPTPRGLNVIFSAKIWNAPVEDDLLDLTLSFRRGQG